MKLLITLLFAFAVPFTTFAQTHFSYDFSTAPKWNYYSNKNNSCKVKNGEYLLSNTGKISQTGFSNDYNYLEFKEGRFSTAFTPVEIDENSEYGLLGGYYGHARFTPEGTYKYYHIVFVINKMKRTYSVYDFSLTGDQHIYDGVPNYFVKDKPAEEITASNGKDDISFCRMKGQWKFSINSVVVYTRPDTSTQYNTGMEILLKNKTSVALDYIDYNYKPAPILQDLPASPCDAKNIRYVNKEYGYSLCLEAIESTSELTYEQYHYEYLKDFVIIKGFSDLPFNVYTIDFKTETDSMLVFKKFEQEYFEKLGAAITAKEISNEDYTKADATTKHGSYFRGYKITLPSGEHAKVCFEYLIAKNDMFDALCFGFLAPEGLEGASYVLRNSALLLQCDVLNFR